MKVRNLIAVLLGASVLTSQAAVPTASIVGVIAVNQNRQRVATTATIVKSTISNMMSSQNSQSSVVIECVLQKEGGWYSHPVPSLKETINSRDCQDKKEILEKLNNTHYEFGKIKGVFTVIRTDHIMIELEEH